jgi:hypothetical protein
MAIDACAGSDENTCVEIGDVLKKLWPYYYGILTMPMAADVPAPLPPLPLQLNLSLQRNNDSERADLGKRVVSHNAQVPTPQNGADDTALDVGPGMTHHGMQGSQHHPLDTKLLNEYENLLQKVICNNCGKTKANTLFIPCRHLVTCHDCAEIIKICGLCGKGILGMVKVYTG